MANYKYKRRGAEGAILRALKSLGGSASRDALRDSIAEDSGSGFSYEDVFTKVVSKKMVANTSHSTLILILVSITYMPLDTWKSPKE